MPKKPSHSSAPIKTRSGRVLKVNRSLGQRYTAVREAKTMRKLDRLRGLPKSKIKRLAWRLQPKRLAAYWFSRDGGIMALKVTGIAILVFFVFMLGVFAFFRKDLPNIKDISGSSLGGSISYYDRTGKNLLWQDYDAVKRIPVQGDDISQYVKDATVAIEDRDFFKHRGFDIRGIGRAALNDLRHGDSRQGGSTITQQLVKLTQDWQQKRTFARKIKELILAVELERTYSKEDILTGYLNTAPYGGIDYGVQVAASDYFHKSAKKLTLAESAMLASIPKSPTLYSPYSGEYFNKKAFVDRYNYVLDSMVQTHKITQKQADAAKKVNILAKVHKQRAKYAGIRAPYFVLAAKKEIVTKYAPKGPGGDKKTGGWKVITTLDMKLQDIAEETVQSNRYNSLNHGADAQALVAEDVKTGQVVALVGGNDFDNEDYGKINYAQWNISPGSSFKPYDYSTFIDNSNAGAGSVLYDVQQPLPGYPCTVKGLPPPKGNSNCLQDYDFRYPGPETLRYALGGSRNIPAVKAMLSAVPGNTTSSINKTIGVANDLMSAPNAYRCYNPGVDVNTATKADETQCYGASAIGDGAYLHLDQHVNGVASLARLGVSIPQTYILKIFDSGSDTKPFQEWKQPKKGDPDVKQVVRPEAAYIVNDMASDPNASYMSIKRHVHNGWHNAIKTGTTNNGFDGLMMSWNTQYAVGSWVGHHTRNQTLSGFMETMTMPLTMNMMDKALDRLNKQPVNWAQPSGIKRLPAYVVRTHIGVASREPSPSTDIYPSWYKPKGSSGQSVTIDKVSGKQATSCTPALAKQNLGGSAAPNSFSADIFYPPGGGSANTGSTATGRDDVHSCSDEHPSVSLTVPATCDNKCTISATPFAGDHPLNDSKYSQFPGNISISVNGSNICTKSKITEGVPVSCPYTSKFSGSGTVRATVTDSVLYQGSDSKSVNFTGDKSEGPTNLQAKAKSGGTKYDFEWKGGAATYRLVTSDNPGDALCTTNDKKCTNISAADVVGKEVYVIDGAGKESNRISLP